MQRRKSSLTPEEYTRAIRSLSRRFSSTSVFPGDNFLDIAEWMLHGRSLPMSMGSGGKADLFASTSDPGHELVVAYNINDDNSWDMRQYTQEQHETFFEDNATLEETSAQLIFIRGFVSPSWVAAIGGKFQIEPEFFRRHMDFLSVSVHRHAYGTPSLASTSKNMFRLCVSTILHRDQFGSQDLQAQRIEHSHHLRTYRTRQLGTMKVACGDSVVRDYSTLCSSFSIIEQWISIYVAKRGKGWAIVACMDQGRPLEKSPPGPWTMHIESKATALPVLQNHHKMAFRTTTNRLNTQANATAQVQQSATLLSSQYESLIGLVDLARRAPQDPLSMCIPLFAHAAFSEVQFLNLVESKIQGQTNDLSEKVQSDTLGTFQYLSNILVRHAQYMKESLRALNRLVEISNRTLSRSNAEKRGPMSRGSLRPNSPRGAHVRTSDNDYVKINTEDGAFTPQGLVEDYEELYTRCLDLSEMCTRGMTLAMNKATIDESRKGIEQSERLKKLTLLATFFIPLSFCSSLFGMNLDILGQGNVKIWWFFVICVPITLLAYTLYLWNWQSIRRVCLKTYRKVYKMCQRNSPLSEAIAEKNRGSQDQMV